MSNDNKDFNPDTMSTGKNPGGSSPNKENSTTTPVENLGLPEDGKNVGAPPADVQDGGQPGEAKQPKEHTGTMTEMGGDAETAASRIPDASEGNSNGLEGQSN